MPDICFSVEALEARTLLSVLPAGFSEAVVASEIPTPTSMAFAPDGRVFVAQQGGQVRIIENGQLLPGHFASVLTNYYGERGLMGITLDPTFGQPGGQDFVYVFYTVTNGANIGNRVSRFLAAGNVVSGAEQILLNLPDIGPDEAGPIWHMGGAINFGQDGKLYISQGDAQEPNSAQDLTNLKGKILRVNKDGSIPTDNPFYNTTTGMNRAIWAYGLRNAFTTTWQPGTDRFYINDVGQDLWEEINEGAAGANYGWPTTEGDFDQSKYPQFTRPLYPYHHSVGNCIVGGAFYNPSQDSPFPDEYDSQYFFADFNAGWMKTLDPATGVVTPFATGMRWITGLGLSPDGAIYYMDRGMESGGGSTGSIYIIQYAPDGAPTITQQPRSQLIAVGESATFTVAAGGNGPLSYQWQRNGLDIDGATATSYTLDNATLADSGDGFRCVVTNSVGTATSIAATLSVAQTTRPVPTILTPVAGSHYSGGELISFSGVAIDEQDGSLAPEAFTWRVDLHHDQHSHSFIPDTPGVQSGSFVIPTSGETSDNVWYRIYLTVTDSHKLSETITRDITPRKATMTLKTNVPGLSITLDGQPRTLPASIVGVQGLSRLLNAPLEQTVAGETYQFVGWSDAGTAQHAISFPSADTMYTAFYRRVTAAPPLIVNGTNGNDDWVARINPDRTRLLVFRNGVQVLAELLADFSTVTFNGSGGDDSLSLDPVNGPFTGVGQLTFNGGANGAGGDVLRIIGSTATDTIDAASDRVFFHDLPITHGTVERLRIETSSMTDVVRINATLNATLQLIGASSLSLFGGATTIDTDLTNGAISVNNDATVNFTTSQHLESLAITGTANANLMQSGNLVLRTNSLSIDTHGTLDLFDNDLLVDYSTASELASIQTLINRGRAGGLWTGEGITSSAARLASPHITTLAAMEASDYIDIYGPAALFDGEAIDNTGVLVKYTYYGDTDFNGQVNFDDYARIDLGFTTNRTGWLNGDFDGGGSINFDDYSLIDLVFNTQPNPLRPANAPPTLPLRKSARGLARG